MLPFCYLVFESNIFITFAVQSTFFGLVYALSVMLGANLQGLSKRSPR